jgi:hypothetical protein
VRSKAGKALRQAQGRREKREKKMTEFRASEVRRLRKDENSKEKDSPPVPPNRGGGHSRRRVHRVRGESLDRINSI